MTLRADDRSVQEWRRLLRFVREATTTLDAELREHRQLSLEDYDVLFQLEEAGGVLRMTELTRAVLVTKSSCTRLVDRLVADGLVERSISEADRRSVEVRTTKQGRSVLRRAAVTHLRGIDTVFASLLTDRDCADLHRILDHLETSHRASEVLGIRRSN
jgi:DNA-binding MarR family transcriptional regulator